MNITKLMATNVSLKTINVLLQVMEMYGNEFSVSYRTMGKKLGMTHENVRYHFLLLEKAGFVKSEKSKTHQHLHHLNMDKIKELL